MKSLKKIWRCLLLTGPLTLFGGVAAGQIANDSAYSFNPGTQKIAVGAGVTQYVMGNPDFTSSRVRVGNLQSSNIDSETDTLSGTAFQNQTHEAVIPDFKNAGVAGAINAQNGAGIVPDAYQQGGWPNSHERASVTGSPGRSELEIQVPITSRPYRFIGKLKVRFGSDWVNCTAALIKRGLILTAAHCVQGFGEGAGARADEIRWFPAHYLPGTGGYFGSYEAQSFFVPSPYADGTDTCVENKFASPSKICNNDLAVVALKRRAGIHAWATLGGWLNYSWNGYSFSAVPEIGSGAIALVNQFGYPNRWDSGNQLQRSATISKIYQVTGTNGQVLRFQKSGSLLRAAGAGGGPWIANFGSGPRKTGGGESGYDFSRNVVVGLTSWHKASSVRGWFFNPFSVGYAGSSWFGTNAEYPNQYGGYGFGNIAALVFAACTSLPDNC